MPSKRVTSLDVAVRAGVSRATVSAVLNRSRPVSRKMVERITKAMRELDYQPDAIARILKGKRTFRIGLIVGNIASPFWAAVINTVENVAYAQGYHVILCDNDDDAAKELGHLQMMARERLDGIILAPCGEVNRDYVTRLDHKIPIVLFDRRLAAHLSSVACDNELGAYLAVNHLIEASGMDRIACLTLRLDFSMGAERLAGYQRALAAHHIPSNPDWIKVGDYAEESTYRDALSLLRSSDRPRALFACSHLKAIGALRAAAELGLSVPEDVAIVGFDEMPWAPFMCPPLTVVAQPITDMAAQATDMLLRHIRARADDDGHGDTIEQVLHRPKLIDRESCGCHLHRG
jgi:LacI family transcriptional regulator